MTVAAERPAALAPKKAQPFIDCDVHNVLPSGEALKPYLAERWHTDYFGTTPSSGAPKVPWEKQERNSTGGASSARVGGGARMSSVYTMSRPHNGPYRWDARTPAGGSPGSDLPFMIKDFLDPWNVEKAILAPLEGGSWPQSGPLSVALCAALNDWLATEWLNRDSRLYGCIAIPGEDARLAAQEIERASKAHRRFVQIEMLVRTRDPMGHARYWPIYEAAAAANLPISVHVGGAASNPAVSAGWPSYHYEFHSGHSQSFQAQVISIIGSGVFKEYPNLKFVMVEGGFAWMGPLIWRMDRAWKLMGKATTHLEESPSDLLRKHIWFSTQPIDQAEDPQHVLQMLNHLDHIGMGSNVMFATDYPHWDFDSPDQAIPSIVTGDMRDRIFRRNAEALFHFA